MQSILSSGINSSLEFQAESVKQLEGFLFLIPDRTALIDLSTGHAWTVSTPIQRTSPHFPFFYHVSGFMMPLAIYNDAVIGFIRLTEEIGKLGDNRLKKVRKSYANRVEPCSRRLSEIGHHFVWVTGKGSHKFTKPPFSPSIIFIRTLRLFW